MKKEKEAQRPDWLTGGFGLDPRLRNELIKEIEAGTPRSVIAYRYGVSRAAISKWMRKYR